MRTWMSGIAGFSRATFPCLAVAMVGAGCAKPLDEKLQAALCSQAVPASPNAGAGATGKANVFQPDPISSSGNLALVPTSFKLDSFAASVNLANLDGRGILAGRFVEARTGACNQGFGAYEARNQFSYSRTDPRFQDAMAYFYGDSLMSRLESLGYREPKSAVRIISHCMRDDNAYFSRYRDSAGQTQQMVCLGDSVSTPGASYGDDAAVTLHELEHAVTINSYSPAMGLNQFWYDEAGALNEAISDFVALTYVAPSVNAALDPKVFSRWALGTFTPGASGVRGAHRCPTWDPSFPNCAGFPAFSSQTSAVSYVYPDGMGWPYGSNYTGPGYARSAFQNYRNQEQIHNAGVLLAGALWDVVEALQPVEGSFVAARDKGWALTLEAVRHLPKPSAANLSPVTFVAFAQALRSSATLLGWSPAEIQALEQALTARGLLNAPTLPSGWASARGMKILDEPQTLKAWLAQIGGDTGLVTQGITTGLNGLPDPGELLAIWFDVGNTSAVTAGGVLIDVQVNDPDVTLADGTANIGAISAQEAQLMYGKINGSAVVAALTSGGSGYALATGASYFQTNPYFARNWNTAFFFRVAKGAAHGKTVVLHVTATPANGLASTVDYSIVIN